MSLIDNFEKLKNKKKFRSNSGTVDIIFDINANYEKDESGYKPIIIKPIIEENKKKKSLN